MNEKFYKLPTEKQQQIINAGYRVFSQNSYKKSPMSEIAAEAGISKSLLFHYFYNKQGLYMFLWENCAKITMAYMTEYKCYEPDDFFEMMYRGLKAKMAIMYQYPNMGTFVLKAFYEKDPAVKPAIQESYEKLKGYKAKDALEKVDRTKFIDGLDIQMMYREMFLATEGYVWELTQKGPVDVAQMEREFSQMIEFWKKIYLKNNN